MERRRLANSDIHVSAVALGCWPIARIHQALVERGTPLVTTPV
jgi:aryl-alcohol dehydrogenase-like predicted oxidoreductase